MKKRGSGFSLVLCHSFVKGTHTLRYAHSTMLRAKDFPFVVAEAGPAAASAEAGAEAGFFCNVYISLRDEGQ
jgi:hypothetical protein